MQFLSQYYKQKYKINVRKISIALSKICPNRENKQRGCIYCYNGSFYKSLNINYEELIEKVLKSKSSNLKTKRVLYFQSFTTTYKEENREKLINIINKYIDNEDIVEFNIGTRADCIDYDFLNTINKLGEKKTIWIEYGLQSSNDKSLQWIRRGHNFKDFKNAIDLTREFKNLKICVHLIFGIPFDNEKVYLQEAQFFNQKKIEAVKFHPLHILKNTVLEEIYKKEKFKLLTVEEYAKYIKLFLKNINYNIIIQRLTADAPDEILIAPSWCSKKEKIKVIQKIKNEIYL